VVFDAPQTVNAYALPGGKVAVYTGLLRVATSDDELAFVLGHEIAHVTSRHGAERATQALGVAAVGAAAAYETKDNKYRDLILAAYGGVSTLGTLAFSRQDESEADFIGLRYSSKAGYDPHAAIAFWQKMSAESEKADNKTPEFLSTHPADERRIAALQQELPQVIPLYEQSKKR
jgi:predicted Zn-dependent protease